MLSSEIEPTKTYGIGDSRMWFVAFEIGRETGAQTIRAVGQLGVGYDSELLVHVAIGGVGARNRRRAQAPPDDNTGAPWALRGDEVSERHVVVLGAGFSRAVHSALPTTDELGNAVLDESHLHDHPSVPRGGFANSSFEAWLARMSQPQPYLFESDNAANAALAAWFRASIARVITARQAAALSLPAPHWLIELLHLFHVERTTVVSLNYDSLIEAGVDSHEIWPDLDRLAITCADVLNGTPPVPPGLGAKLDPAPTFRLLKLHGSADWYAVPNDRTGETLARLPSRARFGSPAPASFAELERLLPGREPFVLPPSATATTGHDNPVVRQLWRNAAIALHTAERITLMGYQMAEADLLLRGLIEDALRESNATVEIVNIDSAPIRKRLLDAGVDDLRITSLEGPDCMEAYAAREVEIASYNLVRTLLEADWTDWHDTSCQVPWGKSNVAEELPHRRVAIGLEESAEDADTMVLVLQRREDTVSAERAVAFSEVLHSLYGFKHLAIRAQEPEASGTVAVIDAHLHPADETSKRSSVTVMPLRALI